MNTKLVAGEAVIGAIDVLKTHPDLEKFSVVEIQNAWGLASSFDIYKCNPETIRDADEIKRFVQELCELIEMKRFGECVVVNFGEDERVAGFSMTQLIETSLISGHFANATNTTYLDVFSCKPYNPKIVEQFAMEFFGSSHCTTQVNLRQ
jgi:S-adenosylmethionine decarboxylase